MSRIAVLLMPWGRVGSNLINSIVQKSRSRRVWNEPLTGVQTRVIGAGGTLADVWPAQLDWLREHIGGSNERVFLNVAANSLGDAAAFRDYMAEFSPAYMILDRRDDLATAISALRTEAWVREGFEKGETRSWAIPSGLAVSFRPVIDPKRLTAAYAIIGKGRANIQEIIGDLDAPRFHYEDLVVDMPSMVGAILAAADIPPYDFKVLSGKFGSDRLSDMVDNAEEVMQTAHDTGIVTELTV